MSKPKINIPREIIIALFLVGAYVFAHYVEDVYMLYTILICCAAVVIPIVLLYFVVRFLLKRKSSLFSIKSLKSFRNTPLLYDQRVIKIIGRVEKVFTTHLTDEVIQSMRHDYKVLIAEDDHFGRHDHQRFLLSSPQMQFGSCVFVSRDTALGQVDGLQPGCWVEVQGEYLHRTMKQKGIWGPQFTYYGLIHQTDASNYIKLLSDKPDVKALGDVEVVDTA